MSDYMLLEYLKGRGKYNEDKELIDEFKHYMRARGKMRGSKRDMDYWDDDYERHDWEVMEYPGHHYAKGYMKDHSMDGTFNEHEAKEIVAGMYHYEMDKKHSGEHFDMHKAKEVLMKYKNQIDEDVTACDVYVAINAFYHDFSGVLKQWFGSTVDEKIILLAITFWFKDADYHGNKLLNYFE